MPGVLVKVLVMAGADCNLKGARVCEAPAAARPNAKGAEFPVSDAMRTRCDWSFRLRGAPERRYGATAADTVAVRERGCVQSTSRSAFAWRQTRGWRRANRCQRAATGPADTVAVLFSSAPCEHLPTSIYFSREPVAHTASPWTAS